MSPHRVINAAQPASFSTGAQQLPEFLLAWPELDALVCASDELAGGALYECQRRRIKVPDNLAVVGFGNSEFSRVCQPPLTTMTIPHRDIGIQAGQALLARLNEQPWLPAGSPARHAVPPRQLLNPRHKSRSMTGFLTRWRLSGCRAAYRNPVRCCASATATAPSANPG